MPSYVSSCATSSGGQCHLGMSKTLGAWLLALSGVLGARLAKAEKKRAVFPGQAQWCAEWHGMPVESFRQECCVEMQGCFDIADGLGNKCCRVHHGGFFGFLLPPLFFHRYGHIERRSNNASLWSINRFQRVSFHAHVRDLERIGVLRRLTEDGTDAFTVFISKERPPIVDRHFSPLFHDHVYRFYHQDSDVVPAIHWEFHRFRGRAVEFRSHLAERSQLRYGSVPCDQPEAGEHQVFSDQTAMDWIAARWRDRRHAPLTSFVNFGAGDGVGDDPLLRLVQQPREVRFALGIEVNKDFCESHRVNLPHVKLVCQQIRTSSMSELVAQLPAWLRDLSWERMSWSEKRDRVFNNSIDLLPSLDAVKMDMDCHDCDILEAFLRRVPAKFVATEVFDGVPPPIRFALHESSAALHPDWPGQQHKAFGCSLSYQVHMLGALGYELVWYSAGNAVFSHRAATPLLGLPAPLDEVDCFSKSAVHATWPDGRTMRRWFQETSLSTAVEEVRAGITAELGPSAFFTAVV